MPHAPAGAPCLAALLPGGKALIAARPAHDLFRCVRAQLLPRMQLLRSVPAAPEAWSVRPSASSLIHMALAMPPPGHAAGALPQHAGRPLTFPPDPMPVRSTRESIDLSELIYFFIILDILDLTPSIRQRCARSQRAASLLPREPAKEPWP